MENSLEVGRALASECLSCVNKPCVNGCPLGNDITEFIKCIKNGDNKGAFDVLTKTTILMPICGRVCPHFKQCMGSCVKNRVGKSVKIGELEAFVGDLAIKNGWKLPVAEKDCGKKVAIVGGGPAGLTCAQFLRRFGVDVTIFEKHSYLGGNVFHGIPDFRLDKSLLEKWIGKILESGIKVEFNVELCKNLSLEKLEKDFDAVFFGLGGNVSKKMNIANENLQGVFGGNEFLENKIKIDCNNKIALVSGGGDVAMDVARTLMRMGAKAVKVVYRRSEAEMPAEAKEIEDAKKDGVEFMFQTNILEILGEKNVRGVKCIKTELVEKPGEKRLVPVNIEGSEFIEKCDYIFMAVGYIPEKDILNEFSLEQEGGRVKVSNSRTNREKVFAGGDLTSGNATVAFASRAGRDAAFAILEFFKIK